MTPEYRKEPEEALEPIEIGEEDIVEVREMAPTLSELTERVKRAFVLAAKFENTRERLEQTPELSLEEAAALLFERAGAVKKEFRKYEKRVGELKEKLPIIFGSDAEALETVFLHDWERINRATAFLDLVDEAAEEIKREPSAEFRKTLLERHEALSRLVEQLGEEAQMILYDVTRRFQYILERDAEALAKDRDAIVERLTIELQYLSDTAEALHAAIYKKEAEPREVTLVGMERFDDAELGSTREQVERLLQTYGVKDIFSKTVATLAYEDRTRDLSAYNIAGTAPAASMITPEKPSVSSRVAHGIVPRRWNTQTARGSSSTSGRTLLTQPLRACSRPKCLPLILWKKSFPIFASLRNGNSLSKETPRR